MGLSRSRYYRIAAADKEDPAVDEIEKIVASFKGYGYRRVTAALRHRGMVVNSKKVRRIMRENQLEPPQLNWSAPMFRKRRTKNGKQETEARRDSFEVTAS